MLRGTLTPIIQDVPFVGGISLSWLEMPMIDFDVKCAQRKHFLLHSSVAAVLLLMILT